MKVYWGILGAANIATSVIPAIQEIEGSEVLAIASRTPEKAKKFAEDFGIKKYYGNYVDILLDKEISAIYIPLPNHLHKYWTIEALKHGKHVLCEKPFALNVQDAKDMFESSIKYNKILMEAFMYRFNPKIEKLRQLLQDGVIGEIKFIDFNFSHPLEEIFTKTDNYRLRKSEGGGALYDLGVYGINLINYLLEDNPEKVITCSVVKNDSNDIDKTVCLQLLYKLKKLVLITASFQYFGNYIQISGTKGIIEVTNIISQQAGELRIRLIGTNQVKIEELSPFNSYKAMIEHFNNIINNHSQIKVTKDQTISTLRIVEDAMKRMTFL